MYNKDFIARSKEKQTIDERKIIHVKPWQIRHCKIGVNIWSEEDGKAWFLRPILVIATIGNMVLVVPTTSNIQRNWSKFYCKINSINFWKKEDWNNIESFVMLSQIRTIDSKRLIKHKYTITKSELEQIKKSFIKLI